MKIVEGVSNGSRLCVACLSCRCQLQQFNWNEFYVGRNFPLYSLFQPDTELRQFRSTARVCASISKRLTSAEVVPDFTVVSYFCMSLFSSTEIILSGLLYIYMSRGVEIRTTRVWFHAGLSERRSTTHGIVVLKPKPIYGKEISTAKIASCKDFSPRP